MLDLNNWQMLFALTTYAAALIICLIGSAIAVCLGADTFGPTTGQWFARMAFFPVINTFVAMCMVLFVAGWVIKPLAKKGVQS